MRAVAVFLAGVSVTAITPVRAQTASAVQAEASDGIIVTARRKSEALQDVPLAVTAIDSANLERQSIGELRDLSSIAPSLVIKEHTNNPQGLVVSLRGQVPAGILMTLDSAVGIYSDGISVPRSVGLRGALVDLARVEVLRGPQGTLYGRNTTGGAISIISNAPTDRVEGSVSLGFGNYSAFNVTGILNLPLSENVAVRFVAQKGTRDGFGRDGLNRELNDEDGTFLRGRLRGSFGALTVNLIAEFSKYKQGGAMARLSGISPGNSQAIREIAAELGLPMTAPTAGFLVGVPATPEALATAQAAFGASLLGVGPAFRNGATTPMFSNYQGENVTLELLLELSDQLSLKSLSGYRHHKRGSQDDLDTTAFDIVEAQFQAHADFLSQEVQLLGEFGDFNFVAGGYASYEKGFDSSRTTTFPSVVINSVGNFDGDVKNKSLGAFGQATWRITDSFALTGGVRYSKETKELISTNNAGPGGCLVPVALRNDPALCRASLRRTDSKPSWLASAEYRFNRDILAYAKFATGFRAGGHNLRGSRTLASYQPFGPESVTEYEVGIKSALFGRKLILNLAAFHDDYRDVQRTVTVRTETGTATTIVTNAAQAKIDGVELEATWRPTSRLTLGASGSYIHARYDEFVDVTGNRTNEDWPTPDWTYALTGRYEMPVSVGSLAFQLDFQGQSRQNLYPSGARPDETSQNAYGLLNGRISLTIDDMGLEASIYGRNLADKVYAAGAFQFEAAGYNLKYLGPPREVGVQVVKRF